MSRTPPPPDDPRHGTTNCYTNHDCRCARCIEAARVYRAARKAAGYVKPDRRKRRGKKVLAPLTDQDDPRHGTMNGYNNHRCRCVECRQANAEYTRDLKRRAEPPPPGDPRHGKATTYRNRKCRCEPCADARRAYERTRRARKRLNAVPDDAVTA